MEIDCEFRIKVIYLSSQIACRDSIRFKLLICIHNRKRLLDALSRRSETWKISNLSQESANGRCQCGYVYSP